MPVIADDEKGEDKRARELFPQCDRAPCDCFAAHEIDGNKKGLPRRDTQMSTDARFVERAAAGASAMLPRHLAALIPRVVSHGGRRN